MRAGPLADEQVIKLLNSCFVPVYISNEDYNPNGSASVAEKKERNRIWHEAAMKKLSSGTVHVYLLTPAGEVFDSMHVAEASGTPKLLAMLEKAVESQKVAAGKTLVPPVPQSACPKCVAGEISLHLVARGSGGGSKAILEWQFTNSNTQARRDIHFSEALHYPAALCQLAVDFLAGFLLGRHAELILPATPPNLQILRQTSK